MKKVLLFAFAVSAASFLSCSADGPLASGNVPDLYPAEDMPTSDGGGGGGGGGSCTIETMCVDEGDMGMTEAACDMVEGDWSEDPC